MMGLNSRLPQHITAPRDSTERDKHTHREKKRLVANYDSRNFFRFFSAQKLIELR